MDPFLRGKILKIKMVRATARDIVISDKDGADVLLSNVGGLNYLEQKAVEKCAPLLYFSAGITSSEDLRFYRGECSGALNTRLDEGGAAKEHYDSFDG